MTLSIGEDSGDCAKSPCSDGARPVTWQHEIAKHLLLAGVHCLCRGTGVVWGSLPRRVPAGVPPGRSQFRGRPLSNLGCLLLLLAGLGLAADGLAVSLSDISETDAGAAPTAMTSCAPAPYSSAPKPRCRRLWRLLLHSQAAQLMTGGGLGREIMRDRAPRLENMPPSLHKHPAAVGPAACAALSCWGQQRPPVLCRNKDARMPRRR